MLTLVSVAGCGRKGQPKPPELVAPTPITDLQAISQKQGILLSWTRPSKHVDGTPLMDLGSFVIERAIGISGDPFEEIATLTLEDRGRFRTKRRLHYLDRGCELRASCAYRVRSVTVDGYPSQTSNVVFLDRQQPPSETPAP